MAKGTLIAAMNMAQVPADEFHDWYDTEHLPERQRVPGFLVCERWIGAEDAKISVATYDLDTVGVLNSPSYLAIGGENLSPWSKRITSRVDRLMRFEGDQILPGDQLPPSDAGGLLLNARSRILDSSLRASVDSCLIMLPPLPSTMRFWLSRSTTMVCSMRMPFFCSFHPVVSTAA